MNEVISNTQVPSLKVVFTDQEIWAVANTVQDILRSGRLTLGKYTERFEQEFAETIGCKYAVAVSCGTAALEVMLRALELNEQSQVIVPTNTNFATAAAAVYAGANVTLVDSGLYIDIEDLKRLISDEIAALIMVHIGGYITPEIETVRQLCEKHEVLLLEDAAHAHGASISGRMAGVLGHAAAFSFFPTKVMTTGEGGIITINDKHLYRKAKQLRDQGIDPTRDVHTLMGNSWRMSEIEAAIGSIQLRSLTSNVEHRRGVINLYQQLLSETEGIDPVGYPSSVEPSGYKCIALLDASIDRSRLRSKLRTEYGVLIGRGVYDTPLHKQPVFDWLAKDRAFPKAEFFAKHHICLPIWRTIVPEDVEYVADSIRAAIGGCRY